MPHTICVEPWGADYTLASGDRIEFVAYDGRSEPSFDLTNDRTQVTQAWCEAETFEVLQEGKVLEFCHR